MHPHAYSDYGRGLQAAAAAEALFTVLDTRGIELTADLAERIQECRDRQQLRTWLQRAATATSTNDLFD